MNKLEYLNGTNAAEGRTKLSMLAITLWTEQWRIDLYKTSKAMVTTQISGVITMRTMFLLRSLKRCMFQNKHFPRPALRSLQR